MKHMTLCLLLKGEGKRREVLLAMKKRDFGKGRYNGFGGKVERGETIKESLIREGKEELGITIVNFYQVTLLDFITVEGERAPSHFRVHTFMSDLWDGEPTESDELRPEWFSTSKIPYKTMWPDDEYWLPEVLSGKNLKATFRFGEKGKILSHKIKIISGFN